MKNKAPENKVAVLRLNAKILCPTCKLMRNQFVFVRQGQSFGMVGCRTCIRKQQRKIKK